METSEILLFFRERSNKKEVTVKKSLNHVILRNIYVTKDLIKWLFFPHFRKILRLRFRMTGLF